MRGILSLATSRKAFLAALVPVLMLLNRKFNLGLADHEVALIVAGLGTLILGIAVEDAGAKKAPPAAPATPGAGVKTLLALALVLSGTGCSSLAPRARDENTIGSIERAIQAREQDFGRIDAELALCREAALAERAHSAAVRKAAADAGVTRLPEPPKTTVTSEQVVNGMRALNEAELDRLRRLLDRERAKMGAEEVAP